MEAREKKKRARSRKESHNTHLLEACEEYERRNGFNPEPYLDLEFLSDSETIYGEPEPDTDTQIPIDPQLQTGSGNATAANDGEKEKAIRLHRPSYRSRKVS